MMGPFSLHTSLVQGRLAYAMRRAAAARAGESGLQILTMPQLAARVAGGLKRPASRESIEAGIIAALSKPARFKELGPVHDMPGMTRALARTLDNIWRSGFDLRGGPFATLPRVVDLAFIEDVIREELKPGEHLVPDLERLARAQLATAGIVLGPVTLYGIHAVDPLWHPLVNELRLHVPVTWHRSDRVAAPWYLGDIIKVEPTVPQERGFSCSNPSHEVLEAMRWARSLIAAGKARPEEIAIAATVTAAWDDDFVTVASASALPLSFVCGRPALTTSDGQRCAALADVLHSGLSQARVRRLLSLVAGQGTRLDELDRDLPVAGEASLTTAADWARALAASPSHGDVLVPILELLARGPSVAGAAGETLLQGGARRLWNEALRRAPASALMFSLQLLRVPDGRDPATAIAWCSAGQLAACPRPFVWLLGMTSSDWPRPQKLDPVLPDYLVPASRFDPDPVGTADRRSLDIIRHSTTQLMCSAGRLDRQGAKASASQLLPAQPTPIYRDRIPRHAVSESDRLLARPADVANDPQATRAMAAWDNWGRKELSAHDGLVGRTHPLLADLSTRPQSPTSLSLLLRDPLAYCWYYVLGWRDLIHKERSLTLPADDFGRLVHDLLKDAVDRLEPSPGFPSAVHHEIDDALGAAAAKILAEWPANTNVPPPVLWTNTVRQAREMSLAALTFEPFEQSGIRSWTEVPFGGADRTPVSPIDLPWDPARPVTLPGTEIRIAGIIDRLDLWPGAAEVHVHDYKTGQKPKKPEERQLAGGQELQRVLYSLACQTLLGEAPRRNARLIYLRPPVVQFALRHPDAVAERLAAWVTLARRRFEAGTLYPGVNPRENDPRFGRLAMPASGFYVDRKDLAIRAAAGTDLVKFWKEK